MNAKTARKLRQHVNQTVPLHKRAEATKALKKLWEQGLVKLER